jgi:hypothetical protein
VTVTFKATTPIAAPVAPVLPDITTGLVTKWNFDGLGLTDGSAVSAVPAAAGSTPTALDQVSTTASRRPTIALGALNGHDVLTFTSGAQQFIRSSQYASVGRLAAPCTKLAVFRRTDSSSGILWAGGVDTADSTAKGLQITTPTTREAGLSVVGGGSIVNGPTIDTAWHVGVFVYNSDSSFEIIDTTTIAASVSCPTATAVDPRDTIGGNAAITGTFFVGQVALLAKWNRALSVIDAKAAILGAKRDLGMS